MESWCEEMRRYIGFGEQDKENLRRLRPHAVGIIPEVVDCFWERALQEWGTRAVLTGGEAQLAKLREGFTAWMEELFSGTYDECYCEKRRRIGGTHVRVGLPQHYMFSGIELVWYEFERRIAATGPAEVRSLLPSLHKLLMLDLAVMMESYKENYSKQIREVERTSMEEKLTRAEHLAGIGQLAASLAHEIKNPLAGISGAIQIIRDELSDDDPHQPILHEVLGQINRLDATVKDLLQYARPTPPRVSRISLNAVVRRVLSVLREEPSLQRVRVAYDNVPTDTVVYADDAQVEQLVMNLLINAAHASEQGGTVHLRIADNAVSVMLTVRDEGKGMTKDVLGKAFEAFFTTKTKGTGLGLPICRRIAEAHGGEIEIASEVGKGTVVTVTLPHSGPAQGGRPQE